MKTSHIDYVELFEFAAIGYLKVNSEGRVDCINSFGSKLLRMERKEAINDFFTDFIVNEHKDVWVKHLKRQDENQYCDLPLSRKDGTIIYTRIFFLSMARMPR